MNLKTIFMVLLLILLTIGCGPTTAESPAATQLPPTLTATTTPTPSPIFAPGTQPITAENAHLLQEIYSLGRGEIYNISVSPDGEVLVVTTAIGVWVYDLETGEVIHNDEGEALHSWFDISDIAWSPDGSMLAVGKRDNGVWVWDTTNWTILTERDSANYNMHDLPGIDWSPDGRYLALGSGLDAVWVWDTETGIWEDWSNFEGQQISLTWTEEGDLWMLGGRGGIYDVLTGEMVMPLNHWIDGFGKGFWSPDNEKILIMFDLGGGVMDVSENEYAFWAGTYPNFAWSPNGDYFATSYSQVLWIYDCDTNQRVVEDQIDAQFEALAYTSEGELLALAIVDGERVLWNYSTGENLFSLNEHLVSNYQFYGLDDSIIIISHLGNINIIDISRDQLIWNFVGEQPIISYKVNEKRNLIVGYDQNYKVYLWNYLSGEQIDIFDLQPETEGISAFSVNPDGDLLAVGDRKGYVQIWNLAQNELIHETRLTRMRSSESWAYSFSWHPTEDQLLIELRGSSELIVLNTNDWSIEYRETTNGDYFLSYDSQILVGYLRNDRLAVKNTDSNQQLFITGNGSISVSPDRRKILVYRRTNNSVIWDIERNEGIGYIPASASIDRVEWSSDSNLIATWTFDQILSLWDANSGELIAELIHHDRVHYVFWSPDGSQLFTVTSDGIYHVWGIP